MSDKHALDTSALSAMSDWVKRALDANETFDWVANQPLSCPCCGHGADVSESLVGWVISCPECGLRTSWHGKRGWAIAAWNQRACTVEESDEELYLDIMNGLFDDLMAVDKDKAELWARAWPELFGKDEDDGCDLV